jgi:hypothetical protein
MRKPDQITVDRALLVSLLCLAEPHGLLNDVKLQQLAFLAELQMFNKGVKGLHCEFFRYAYGAFSKERVENFSVAEEAQEVVGILQEASRGVETNEQVLAILEAVVTNYAPQDTGAITNSVEAVELTTPEQPDFKLAIRDISFHSTLLVPHRIEVKGEFTVPPAILTKLNAAMGY